MSLPDRFMAKVEFDPFGGCWLWSGALRKGYGCFYLDGKHVAAHRYAYLTLVGPFEEGLQPDHLCRVPCCVNPAHLEPVTTGENTRRGNSPGTRYLRGAKHCAHGHLMTAENTKWGKGTPGRPWRRCRACIRVEQQEYYAAHREKILARHAELYRQRRAALEQHRG